MILLLRDRLRKNTLIVEYAGNKTTFDIKIISENIKSSDNKEDNTDDTLAEGALPNAGGKNIIFIVISLVLIISVIFNKKYKKYKDI